jgi:hypothetical protein
MIRCHRCHRPMKHATASGLGPVCGKRAKPAERDLFGYDLDRAQSAARAVVREVIEAAALRARMAVRRAYLVALERAGL